MYPVVCLYSFSPLVSVNPFGYVVGNSLAFVIGPTIPSATRPLAVWKALIAETVYGPNIPSTVPV